MSKPTAISQSRTCPSASFPPTPIPLPRVGVAIGDQILDLAALEDVGLLSADPAGNRVFNRSSLNGFMALGGPVWRETRARISELLRHDNPQLREELVLRASTLVPMAEATLHLPVEIGDIPISIHPRNTRPMSA